MRLRPRQDEFVRRCLDAVESYGNTLGVAPTGAGKTVIMSAIAGKFGRVGIMQHRDELVEQNLATFRQVNPSKAFDCFTADRKRWSPGVTFGMVQTLSRENNIDTIPALDLLMFDECHHVGAQSWSRLAEVARAKNPNVKIIGVTATPARSDKKSLLGVFDNVADVITLNELIQAGLLVRPRTFVVDIGLKDQLEAMRPRLRDEYDMSQVEKLMDVDPVTDRVIAEWRRVAGDRQTIFFCSTVKHAEDVAIAFNAAGIAAECISDRTPSGERRRKLKAFDKREFQVLTNVAVLTEGFDCQPVACVGLLRPCSFKSVVIQMVGRGLRKVDPARYPGVTKTDCVILDFGYSLLTHGTIEADVTLEYAPKRSYQCPECGVALAVRPEACPICGAELVSEKRREVITTTEKGELVEFVMTEIEFMNTSPFKWESLWGGTVYIANGLTAEVICLPFKNVWHAFGRSEGARMALLGRAGDKIQAMSTADDFLRLNGDKSGRKSQSWLSLPPTDKQVEMLALPNGGMDTNRYRASCLLSWKFNERNIKNLLEI